MHSRESLQSALAPLSNTNVLHQVFKKKLSMSMTTAKKWTRTKVKVMMMIWTRLKTKRKG